MESAGVRQYLQFVATSVRALAVVSAVLFFGGFALAAIFNQGANLTGVHETLWRIGGLMVYLSMVTIPLTGLLALITAVRCRRSGQAVP
jgi:hypothetical protein